MYYCISAESAAQPCHAPRLDNGYFVPEQHMYAHESMLTYACDNKHKPVIENWWAKITCQNGNWSHKPQCIGKCFINIAPGLSEGCLKLHSGYENLCKVLRDNVINYLNSLKKKRPTKGKYMCVIFSTNI